MIFGNEKGRDAENNKTYGELSPWFYIPYIICFGFNPVCFLLSTTLLGKIAKPRTRGSFFAINGLVGSIVIIGAQGLGSATSDKDSSIEFFGAVAINGLALLVILICAMLGKLKL